VIRTEILVFKEATTGPLNRAESEYASWSPEEADGDAARLYAADLTRTVDAMLTPVVDGCTR
jgi:hypothetical protein